MNKILWFQRASGSPIRTLADCECRSYSGRTHCFHCVTSNNQEESEQKVDPVPKKPFWWQRWIKTNVLTPTDVRFLSGQPEVKPFYKRKKYNVVRPPWREYPRRSY